MQSSAKSAAISAKAEEKSPEELLARTQSGIEVPITVTSDMCAAAPPPGEYPYTRGIFPNGYRGRLWTIRQYSGFGRGLRIEHDGFAEFGDV